MQLPHMSHPIWILLRMTIALVGMYAILHAVATQFDDTEKMTLIGMFLVLGGGEGLNAFIGKRQNNDRSDH